MEKTSELPERTVYPVGGALIEYLIGKGNKELLKRFIKEQRLAGYGTVKPVYKPNTRQIAVRQPICATQENRNKLNIFGKIKKSLYF